MIFAGKNLAGSRLDIPKSDLRHSRQACRRGPARVLFGCSVPGMKVRHRQGSCSNIPPVIPVSFMPDQAKHDFQTTSRSPLSTFNHVLQSSSVSIFPISHSSGSLCSTSLLWIGCYSSVYYFSHRQTRTTLFSLRSTTFKHHNLSPFYRKVYIGVVLLPLAMPILHSNPDFLGIHDDVVIQYWQILCVVQKTVASEYCKRLWTQSVRYCCKLIHVAQGLALKPYPLARQVAQ
jgi:hypothetical protein